VSFDDSKQYVPSFFIHPVLNVQEGSLSKLASKVLECPILTRYYLDQEDETTESFLLAVEGRTSEKWALKHFGFVRALCEPESDEADETDEPEPIEIEIVERDWDGLNVDPETLDLYELLAGEED